MLFVCITFDYELFLQDNNASYEDILFHPTEKIRVMLDEENVKGTFFADVCSAIVHQKYGFSNYAETFLKQIQFLTNKGHDVQLHLHPSWYRAKCYGNKLVPTYDGYRLHEFGFSDDSYSAIKIINDGVDYLNNYLGQVNKEYKCIAYRAGGFALQPEHLILEAMIRKGVLIDSSIVPRMNNDLVNGFDYSAVPNLINWWIDPKHGLNNACMAGKDRIFEVPVATLRPNLLKYLGLPSEKLRLPPGKLLGTYVTTPTELCRKSSMIKRLYRRLFDYRYVSLDTRYYERVLEDLIYIHKKYDLSQNDGYICLICHPKLADDCRVENIRALIKEIKKNPDLFGIVTMREIYDKVYDKFSFI